MIDKGLYSVYSKFLFHFSVDSNLNRNDIQRKSLSNLYRLTPSFISIDLIDVR